MIKMNPLDASWLVVESRETPMHVASLLVFSPPPKARSDYLQKLIAFLRQAREFQPPWNLKLAGSPLRRLLPAWETDHALDLDYHLRHSALPAPGGERELGVLVSRLHSHPLDFSRPLWECHLIEGLEGGRFALYTKMHHSLVDGVGGMRMLSRALAPSPRVRTPAPWSVVLPAREGAQARASGALQTVLERVRGQARSLPELARALRRLLAAARANASQAQGLVPPYAAPPSVLNVRITGARRFATQQYELARLKRLAKSADATLNDLVLWLCATALRRFLKEAGALPRKPLTAGIPVNVRPAGEVSVGNAISFMMASLATDVADPRRRLEAIKASTSAAKAHLQSLPREALTQYTVLLMAPYMLELLTGLGGRARPIFNLTISNVPGPRERLYFRGARLEAMYPVSLLSHGQALNITCLSYADTLNFGFTGCRDTLPHMQRLAVYCGESLTELESLY